MRLSSCGLAKSSSLASSLSLSASQDKSQQQQPFISDLDANNDSNSDIVNKKSALDLASTPTASPDYDDFSNNTSLIQPINSSSTHLFSNKLHENINSNSNGSISRSASTNSISNGSANVVNQKPKFKLGSGSMDDDDDDEDDEDRDFYDDFNNELDIIESSLSSASYLHRLSAGVNNPIANNGAPSNLPANGIPSISNDMNLERTDSSKSVKDVTNINGYFINISNVSIDMINNRHDNVGFSIPSSNCININKKNDSDSDDQSTFSSTLKENTLISSGFIEGYMNNMNNSDRSNFNTPKLESISITVNESGTNGANENQPEQLLLTTVNPMAENEAQGPSNSNKKNRKKRHKKQQSSSQLSMLVSSLSLSNNKNSSSSSSSSSSASTSPQTENLKIVDNFYNEPNVKGNNRRRRRQQKPQNESETNDILSQSPISQLKVSYDNDLTLTRRVQPENNCNDLKSVFLPFIPEKIQL